jgi:subtilisin family serine protease
MVAKRASTGFTGLVVAFVVLAALSVPAAVATAQTAPTPSKLQPGLVDRLSSGELSKFVVEVAGRADLRVAAGSGARRGQATYDALVHNAQTTQAGVLAAVRATPGARATSYWIANEVVVHGDAALAQRLAARSDVNVVRAAEVVPVVEPVASGPALESAVQAVIGDPEWGVEKIRADEVWADGILGSGIIVGSVDTGVDYTHPALVNQYRGNLGAGGFDHNYNWWDPTGICGPSPCDNAGHGTHTMGTMLGGDGPGPFAPDVGVAPGARWMSAKGCEDFFCSEEALLSSGQFIAAPTDLDGNNADPSKRPDIVNNSWGGGGGSSWYQGIVDAWRAAGIVPVFSAGNDGPDCSTGGTPGDYLNVIAAGATDIDDQIAEFSSRGPSSFGKIDPDVSAPGVNVTSSVPGGGYGSNSGTSMAAPHVSGTIALMLSAKPSLAGNYDAVRNALTSTAIDRLDDQCGGDVDGDPNNVYGDGRIDAATAVGVFASGGTLAGTVTDADTGIPIAGATASATGGGRTYTVVADDLGNYQIVLAAGTYDLEVVAFGYAPADSTIVIETDQTTDGSAALDALPRATISGHVIAAEDGSPIDGATVRAVGAPVPPAKSRADGSYKLTLPVGSYTLQVGAGGCTVPSTADIDLTGDVTGFDLTVASKLDHFGHACRPIAVDWVNGTRPSALSGDNFSGRFTLPFSFTFYTETYTTVYASDNGYLTFGAGDTFHPVPSPIPSGGPPGTAVYGLWQDLHLDSTSEIRSASKGTSPNRVFVIEYRDVLTQNGDRISFEFKIWETGQVDVLYGANLAAVDGSDALVGIEAPLGQDALQFSFLEPLISPHTAFRYEVVPTGVVQGAVTDRNTGAPLGGVTLTATPGGRSSVSFDNGRYALRLRPGSYTLTASKPGWSDATGHITIVAGQTTAKRLSLAAPLAEVDPLSIVTDVTFGRTLTETVTLANGGTAPLEFNALTRDLGGSHPVLPPAVSFQRAATWSRVKVPGNVTAAGTTALPPDALLDVVTDATGDSFGAVDVAGIRAGSDLDDTTVAVDFTPDTPMSGTNGYVMFDTDQNAATGFPPTDLFGVPEQDIGVDYFADMFGAHDPVDPVVTIWNSNFDFVAEVTPIIDGTSIIFSVPLAALGGDDGVIDVVSLFGDFGPEDWAPDSGHGTIEAFGDVSWLDVAPSDGTVAPGASVPLALSLGSADLQPGTYDAQVALLTNSPTNPIVFVDVTLNVRLPGDFGEVIGTVTDAHTGALVTGTLTIHAQRDGAPLDISVPAGAFDVFAPGGAWPSDVEVDGYVTEHPTVTVVARKSTQLDVSVHRAQPHATLTGGAISVTLPPGGTASASLRLGNAEGHVPLEFTVGEAGGGASAAPARAAARGAPPGSDPSARDARAFAGSPPDRGGVPEATGDVLASWDVGSLSLPWGVGVTSNVWISDPDSLVDAQFTPDGVPVSQFDTPWVGQWNADMAFDAGRGLLWQVNVGGDNGIYGIDPADGSVEASITGSPWTNTSQRGLAYDGTTDTFYIGGWNEGIVYHVAGLSWPTPGEVLNQCAPDDPNISGLAYNAAFGVLWETTNFVDDTIWLIDATTCAPAVTIPFPDPGFNGAGIEMDVVGNLWVVSQGGHRAYLIDSGVPNLVDVPWLSVAPDTGTVAVGRSKNLGVTIDTTGMAPGHYSATIVVQTNDPDNAAMTVPVDLLVTAYQQKVNVGGGEYVDRAGATWVADRTYRTGSFGYTGPAVVATTAQPIGATTDDPLYQDQQSDLKSYRFDVPNGHYQVALHFAELADLAPFGRVFDIQIEGVTVATNVDLADIAGVRRAIVLTMDADVVDGRLDVSFVPKFGAPPVLNAIDVVWTGPPPS